MKWKSLEQAQKAFNVIGPMAHQFGYLCAMYGSTLMEGCGDDLDLIMVPWRTGADEGGCVKALIDRFMGRLVDCGQGAMKSSGYVIETHNKLLIDLQFRTYPLTAEDMIPDQYQPKNQGCQLPPPGWWCSREPGHEGPCPARPDHVIEPWS